VLYVIRGRRGVSEVLGAIVIAVLVLGMSASYILLEMERSERETFSLIDLIRRAERRQKILLSLIYYQVNDGQLEVYIYNFGDVSVTPVKILTDVEVDSFEIYDASVNNGGLTLNEIPSETLVKLVLPVPSTDAFSFVLVTEEGGIFVWEMML